RRPSLYPAELRGLVWRIGCKTQTCQSARTAIYELWPKARWTRKTRPGDVDAQNGSGPEQGVGSYFLGDRRTRRTPVQSTALRSRIDSRDRRIMCGKGPTET